MCAKLERSIIMPVPEKISEVLSDMVLCNPGRDRAGVNE